MKKYKSLVVSSLIATIILSVPFASFAKSNESEDNSNKTRVENKVQLENNSYKFGKQNSNSIWNRFARFMESNNNTKPIVNKAPTISGITAPTVLKTGEMGTWVVKASDVNNGTLSYGVDWRDESNIFSKTIAKLSQPVFIQDATFTYIYSKNGKYEITFTVSNSTGQKTTSKVTVHIVGQTVVVAPVISNLSATSIKPSKAIISWNTDTKANSSIWISKVSPVDTSINPNTLRKALVLNHKIEIKKLEAKTTYYVIVKSTNKSGTTLSKEISFTTPSIITNTSSPVITGLKGASLVKVGETQTVVVNAYDPQNGPLSYSALWGDENIITKNTISTLEKPIFVQSATFNHVYTIPGTYTATFTVENSDGKKDTSSMKILVTPTYTDITNPIISNIDTLTSPTTSTVSWTTDEPSNSEVFYSLNTPVDVNAVTTPSISNKSLVKNHSLNIPGLTPGTIYHFIVKSADVTSNTTISSESAFMTNTVL